MNTSRHKGSIVLLVLVFAGIFFTLLMALSGFALTENRAQDFVRAHSEALNIAEAGVNYYSWFLSHFPGNIQNGTGHPGPYVVPYDDPQGGSAGTYTLAVKANGACGSVQSIDVTSTGVPSDAPSVSSVIQARFAAPSVARFSYVVGSSVWAGSDRVINGPYHSNGGIRMDGATNAPVTSSLSTWDCTSSFGCLPAQSTAPGVTGNGPNQNLWSFPTPQIDFAGIAANFSALKSVAQESGLYFGRFSSGANLNNSYFKGYHLVFNANGTVSVYKVGSETKMSSTPINPSFGTTDYTLINNENIFGTFTIPSNCPVIFIEDHAWIEGTISGKVTVIAADVADVGVTPYVVLKNNILYTAYDGTAGLTVISAGDILIAPDSPMNMTLNGIFIAQGGAFGRNLYPCPGPYEPRGTLTMLGTTVSNLRTGTKWLNGCGGDENAGYQTRIDAYDRQNAANAPPFTPGISSQWQLFDWQQKQ